MSEQPNLCVLYEDDTSLVVNKPPGVLTQSPPGIDSLEVRVKQYLAERSPSGRPPYVGVPHRLDRPASGAIAFAKTRRAARRLAEQFEMRIVQKTYWAIVQGHLGEGAGTWTDFVRKIPDAAQAECVPADHPEGRQAILTFRTIERTEELTWLEIELRTGRTHQIRVQFASRGYPVLGDLQYGAQQPFGPLQSDVRQRPIALHARQLSFRPLGNHDPILVTAAPPRLWAATGLALPGETRPASR